jgi:putative MFS transporter
LQRFLQGVGLGGETPVAVTYLNEISPVRLRGRMVFTLQATFALGVLSTAIAALWLIPAFGWRSMLVVGAAPLLLAMFLPRLMDQLPRWLALRGRLDEADRIVADAERSGRCDSSAVPIEDDVQTTVAPHSPAGLGSLLRDGYMARTLALWGIAFCIAVAGFGVTTWMPTLYKTVYHLPIDQVLRYGLATIFASFLGALEAIPLIDLIGRKWCFGLGFAGGSFPLLILSRIAESTSAFDVMLLAATANAFLAFILAGIYVYAPEIYPTRMRALGAGAASAWLRVGAVAGPLLVGMVLPTAGIEGVFLLLGGMALLGLGITCTYAIETKGKALDTIAR